MTNLPALLAEADKGHWKLCRSQHSEAVSAQRFPLDISKSKIITRKQSSSLAAVFSPWDLVAEPSRRDDPWQQLELGSHYPEKSRCQVPAGLWDGAWLGQGSLELWHSPIQHSRRAQGVVFTTSGGSTPTLRHRTKATLTVFICREQEHSLSAGLRLHPRTPAGSNQPSHLDYFKQGLTDEIFHVFY